MKSAGVYHRLGLVVASSALLVSSEGRAAEPLRPAAPKEYTVQLRYRIQADQVERLRQFYSLVSFLEKQGFRKDPGSDTEAEDAGENRMTGAIAGPRARALLLDPRVKALLLLPTGYQVPAEGPVKVQIDLATGLPPDRQLLLEEQSRATLQKLGFKEKLGYDNHGHARLLGTIPVEELETLLRDLRDQPEGWLAPVTPRGDLPQPLRQISPLRVIEVLPEPEGVQAAREAPTDTPPPAAGREYLLKITPELRDLAMQEGQIEARRLDVILDHTPTPSERAWRADLIDAANGLVIEGRIGPLVTVRANPKAALALAELPIVSTVRLSRPLPPPARMPVAGADDREARRAAGLDQLHSLGHQGQGIRVAVIDTDFRGYEKLLGKQLPAATRYVDLAAERNADLQPDPFAGDSNEIGHGTESALAVLAAAPQVDLTLVRVDSAAPHQLQEVARYLHGDDFRSESSLQRTEELTQAKNTIAERRAKLQEERKIVLDKFTDTSERELLKKRPKDKLTPEERELLQDIDRHDAYFKAAADLDRDEKTLRDRTRRFLDLQAALRALQDINVVSSSLVWNEGLPLGSDSSLSRYFEERPFHSALWFQSAGNTHGQVWSGLFRDDDGNGVMEFAPAGDKLPSERWSTELNFLGWQPAGKSTVPDLPAKARARLTIQWREAHAPELYRQERDVYREPLAALRVVVLRQRDPKGQQLAADDFEVVARTEGLPQRLENQPTFSVYEQAVEFTVDPAGRYAVRVEGRVPTSTRPSAIPTVPALQMRWELRPRIFVDVVDPASRTQGRVVFLDYPTEVGAMGTPADAREVITIGAADIKGKRQAASTEGTPFHAELSNKPDALSLAGAILAAQGSNHAVSFAAGLTAASLSAGKPRVLLLESLRQSPDKPIRVP